MSQKTYRIGEAAAALNLKTYVLRFWETEFSQIAPIRTEKGQRLYTESDLAVLGRIRYLLHERGLTIDGARRLLQEEAARGVTYTQAGAPMRDGMAETPEYAPEYAAEYAPDQITDETGDDADQTAGDVADAATREPVQGSLFPPGAAPAGRPAAPGPAADEIRFILTELAAIHRLLVRDTHGGTP